MSYEFQPTLYRTRADVCRAIASEWLSAGGLNSRADMLGFLAEATDAALAKEAIREWGLDQPSTRERHDEDNEVETGMEARGVDEADITEGFNWVKENFDSEFHPGGSNE